MVGPSDAFQLDRIEIAVDAIAQGIDHVAAILTTQDQALSAIRSDTQQLLAPHESDGSLGELLRALVASNETLAASLTAQITEMRTAIRELPAALARLLQNGEVP